MCDERQRLPMNGKSPVAFGARASDRRQEIEQLLPLGGVEATEALARRLRFAGAAEDRLRDDRRAAPS